MATIEQAARQVSLLAPKVMAGVKGEFFTEDVTAQQMITILVLGEMGKVKITDISSRMAVSPPTITGIVDRLERAGYVERVRDIEDRRIVFVVLTKKGKAFVEKLRATIQSRWMKVLVYLNDQERQSFVQNLKKIADGLAGEGRAQKGTPVKDQ